MAFILGRRVNARPDTRPMERPRLPNHVLDRSQGRYRCPYLSGRGGHRADRTYGAEGGREREVRRRRGTVMGAELWDDHAPWHPNPITALGELQKRFLGEYLSEHGGLGATVGRELAWIRDAVRETEAEGDPYDLLGQFRPHLAFLEEGSRRPLPEDPLDQIALLRRVVGFHGAGVGNVLDVTTVTDERGMHTAQTLTADQIRRLCGTEHPTLQQAELAVEKIDGQLDRGESICFPIFAETIEPTPVGWYFIGETVD